MSSPRRFATMALSVLLLLSPLALAAQQARPQGEWQLNEIRSDSVPARFGQHGPSESRRGGRPGEGPGGEGPGGMGPGAGGPGMDGPGRRGGPGHGRRERQLDEKGLARIHQTLELLRDPPRRLRISPDGGTINLLDRSGNEMTLYTDGSKFNEAVENGGDVENKAYWKAESLIIERKVEGGGKITETYGLGLDGTRLLAFVEVSGIPQPLAITRQYQPSAE
jgi:hypothetical protein